MTTTERTTVELTPSDRTVTPSDHSVRTTSVDYCTGVQCLNHGVCKNHHGNFRCDCKADFKGQYCQTRRQTSTHVYDVQFTLVRKYSSGLQLNETFKHEIRNALHVLYREHLHDSTIRVDAMRFRPGSVLVQLELVHTVYTDSVTLGAEAMRSVLQRALTTGRLGNMAANLENFKFELKTGTCDYGTCAPTEH